MSKTPKNLKPELCNVFVYGTLQTGQRRESNWPHLPGQVQRAWTLGKLYDTGPYPALLAGTDLVAGQLWTIRPQHMPQTLKVLDEIEGTNQPGVANDYDREIRDVFLPSGETVQAYLYLFAVLDLVPQFEYLPPELDWNQRSFSIWPKGSTW